MCWCTQSSLQLFLHQVLLSDLLTRMASQQLQNQLRTMRDALLKEGVLDDMFLQVEELQDLGNPNFAEEIVKIFFKEAVKYINTIEQALKKSPVDFVELDHCLYKFKGGSSSIGAAKLMNKCVQFRECIKQKNSEGFLSSFEHVKEEYASLRKKLETYFQLARQVGPSETASRPL